MELLDIYICSMREEHIPQVMEVESQCFPDDPWEYPQFYRCTSTFPCIGYVAEVEDEIVGYAVIEIKDKMLELTNIAVNPAYRRQGIATRLFQEILKKAATNGYTSVECASSEHNEVAHLFLRSIGARAVEIVSYSSEHTFYVFQYIVDRRTIR